MKKPNDKLLFTAWGVMFALTAALGFFFPNVRNPAGRAALTMASILFFLPPWLILHRAKSAGNVRHLRLIRWISLASVGLTVVLLVANLRSAGLGEALGAVLNAALVIVSAPMVCSNFYVLPIFLWGTLIMGSFGKKG